MLRMIRRHRGQTFAVCPLLTELPFFCFCVMMLLTDETENLSALLDNDW
jgi:cyanate permease